MPVIYPFTAIVGQERMKRALVLNAVDPRIGGVLIRGERGTAKSTAARALAALLPHVRVVADCRFGCDPDRPVSWCTECRERAERGEQLPTSSRATPFINLPISATEDRVVGTLDIEKAIQRGERHFEPGVLAAANRGLLYIDEVNLLDDHVVDEPAGAHADSQGHEREKNPVNYGAKLRVKEGDKVKKDDVLAEWDPFSTPILAEVSGIVKYGDLIEGNTFREQVDDIFNDLKNL